MTARSPLNTHKISRGVVGSGTTLWIDENEYNSLIRAKAAVFRGMEIDEKTYLFCQFYRELETEYFDLLIRNTLYRHSNYEPWFEIRISLSQRIMALVTAGKLIVDSLQGDVLAITDCEKTADRIRLLKRGFNRYSIKYRFMHALRNYGLHESILITSSSLPSSWSDDREVRKHGLRVYFETSQLRDGTRFNSAVRREVDDLYGGKVDLMNMSRSYFAMVCNLHRKSRALIENRLKGCYASIHSVHDRFKDESSEEDLFGLSLWKADTLYSAEKGSQVAFDPEIFSRPKLLSTRMAGLIKMQKVRFELYPQ